MQSSQLRLELADEAAREAETRIETTHLHVRKSTFKGGLTERVHRWFRLTPSFGPELVRQALRDMDTPAGAVVLDPFAGAGTTLIEARLLGHQAFGFEINPLLHFVCRTSLEWDLNPLELRGQLQSIREKFFDESSAVTNKHPDAVGLEVPPIHNVYRWWRPDVLTDLLLLLRAVRSQTNEHHRTFFELAVAGVLVPDLTNVTLGRLQLHFIDRDKDQIDVWRAFHEHTKSMIDDLEYIQQSPPFSKAGVFLADSTTVTAADGLIPAVDRVVTSPPYPNRYSYVWNTRPHLYMLGFFRQAREASDLDLKTIGGTWGTATSCLAKGHVVAGNAAVEAAVSEPVEMIRQKDVLMANYVMKYFNKLAEQIRQQDGLLASGAKGVYVVGCSRIKEVFIETDVLLAKLMEGLGMGYSVTRIERFRKRNSGKDLHEAMVFFEKP